MAVDKETNEAIQSTALAVVESQQKVVGSALVGGTGATLLAESTDSQSQILEQIREIQINTLRGIRGVKDKLVEMLTFEKDQARLEREQANEKLKEEPDTGAGEIDTGAGEAKQDVEEGKGRLQAIGQFFAGLPGVGFITKLFKPILAFFGKGGMLVKLFGRFGPLGAFIIAATLIYKYADDIAKALAPVVDKIKGLIVKLQPAIDVIMKIGDFLIKGIIKGIGEALNFVVGTVEKFIDGFKKLFEGDLVGAFNDIFEGILRVIFAVPLMIVNFLKPLFLDLVNMISEPWNNMVNAVHEYIGNIFTSISDFFGGMVDSVVGFFTTAWDNATAKITEGVTNMFNFMSDLFKDTFNMVKNFVSEIPNKIMSFVSDMFSPILDFFNGIGTRIKMAVNGIIDSLPLPEFVKDKMKFDIEPTQAQLDDANTGDAQIAEKIASDEAAGIEKIAGKYNFKDGVYQENGRDLEVNNLGFAESIADEIGEQVKVAMNEKSGKFVIVKKDLQLAENPNKPNITGPDNITDIIGSDGIQKSPNIKMQDVGPVESGTAPVTQIVNSSPVNTQTNVASSTTHAGKLDIGIDPYHDRHAYVA